MRKTSGSSLDSCSLGQKSPQSQRTRAKAARGVLARLGPPLLAVMAWAGPGMAQDDAAKNAARELAEQAAKALEQGDAATAQDLYARAYALVPAPTLSVRRARALVKLGRWVEAVEAYVRATRTPLQADSPDAYREAVQQGYDELAKLRPRVPRLTVVIEGSDPKDPSLHVELDGKVLAPALIGVASPVDPGEHQVAVQTQDGRKANARVALAEKEQKLVRLALPAPGPGAATAPAPAPRIEPVSKGEPEHEPKSQASASSTQRTLAYASLGVGAAGVVVGVVAGLIATSKHSSAKDACPGGNCVEGSQGASDLDAFHRFRTVSTIGYVVGAVGVGAGVTLWLTSPRSKESARVGTYLGVAGAGVRGSF